MRRKTVARVILVAGLALQILLGSWLGCPCRWAEYGASRGSIAWLRAAARLQEEAPGNMCCVGRVFIKDTHGPLRVHFPVVALDLFHTGLRWSRDRVATCALSIPAPNALARPDLFQLQILRQ
jgi:hypothetical protein